MLTEPSHPARAIFFASLHAFIEAAHTSITTPGTLKTKKDLTALEQTVDREPWMDEVPREDWTELQLQLYECRFRNLGFLDWTSTVAWNHYWFLDWTSTVA